MVETPILIRSKQNALIRQIRAALRAGNAEEGGLLPFEGPTLLREALKSNTRIESLLLEETAHLDPVVERWLMDQHARLIHVTPEVLASISDTEAPQGMIGLARLPRQDLGLLLKSPRGLFVVLVGLQDPGNLGTIIRCAEAFGVTAVLSTKGTVNAYNSKSVRATAGSIFRMPVFQNLEEIKLFEVLKQYRISTVATSLQARSPSDGMALRLPLALFIGQEAKGLPEKTLKRCQKEVRIAMNESVQSLNAAIATGILLYEISRHDKGH